MSSPPFHGRGGLPSSSPLAPTNPTLYSPELGRHQRSVAQSSVAKVFSINNTQYKDIHPLPHLDGTFINELTTANPVNEIPFISRFLRVDRMSECVVAGSDPEMEQYLVQHQMKLYAIFAYCVPTYSRGMNLRFDSIQDACSAKQLLSNHGFECSYMNSYDFAIAKSQDTTAIDEFEGQLKLVIMIQSTTAGACVIFTQDDLQWLHHIVDRILRLFGTVRVYVHCQTHEESTRMWFTFRVEFHSGLAATRAAASLQQDPLHYFDEEKGLQWSTVEATNWVGPRAPNSPHRHQPAVDDQGRFKDFVPLRQINMSALRCHPADAHNQVKVEHILDGTDVRTTVMLRNIPNKLDWLSLKALLDQWCFGTYDFSYLRIDFKTGCNVGYAFINFSDVRGMIAMLDKIGGHGWVGYRSSKNAEVSYATIQGREALVQKFRNSSVMQETPFCRPRLFVSYEEAAMQSNIRQTGVEQAFSPPDNLSKLQRSMESAKTVGLFPPSGISNANRMTMTGFDRGNPREMRSTNTSFRVQQASTMSDHFKRQCEVFNLQQNGPSFSGNMIPFDHLSQNVIAEVQRWYRPTARIADPGVIARPQLGNAVQGTLNVYDPRNDPFYTGRASGPAFAGPSTSPRGSGSAFAGPSTSPRGSGSGSGGRFRGRFSGFYKSQSFRDY